MSEDIYEDVDAQIVTNRDLQLKILGLLSDHAKQTVDVIMELEARLSRINLQTNGAAAIAVLAFIGTGLAPDEIVYALLIFVLGVVAAGIQTRCQHGHFSEFLDRTSAGRKSIREGEFKLSEAMQKSRKEVAYDKANTVMGWASQLLFVVGVTSGSWIFWRYSHGDVSVTFGMF